MKSKLKGMSYADQRVMLKPDDKTTGADGMPKDITVAIAEGSTSDTTLTAKPGTVLTSMGGFKKDVEYSFPFNVSRLDKIGEAKSFDVRGVKEAGPAISTGLPGDGYIKLSNGKQVMPGGKETQDIAFWRDAEGGAKASPNGLTVNAANNGMLCLMRLARSISAGRDAMGTFGENIRFLTSMEIALPKDGSKGDPRKQNYYAGTLPVRYKGAAVNGRWGIVAAMMAVAGKNDKIEESAREGFVYKSMTDPAAIAAKLEERINANFQADPTAGEQHTYVDPDLPIATLFMSYVPRLQKDGVYVPSVAKDMLDAWKEMVKQHVNVDWLPDRHADFKAEFITGVKAAIEHYWTLGKGAVKVYEDLQQTHKLESTTRETNKVSTSEKAVGEAVVD